MALPVLKKTPGGQPSTAEAVLVDLAQDYELPQMILSYRSLAKLKSTYADKLPLDIQPATGRIHTSYHQAVAATGRLSSSDPNLQNIPIRNAEGRRIRQAFVAPPGRSILAADYSQIELRIMAHLSGDAGLTQAFAENQDIHRATAAEVFGLAPDAVADEQRHALHLVWPVHPARGWWGRPIQHYLLDALAHSVFQGRTDVVCVVHRTKFGFKHGLV